MPHITSNMVEVLDQPNIDEILAPWRQDYWQLNTRIRTLGNCVKSDFQGVTLRLHFPAIRQGKPTVAELVDCILDYMTVFTLPRSETKKLFDQYGKISHHEYRVKTERLLREATSLFKRAQKATNRNGEAGELLLYVLTEWILHAPQLLAKMSLKTNRNMPVHGADGLHVSYSPKGRRLYLYWGESKIISDVSQAIRSAATSIARALREENVEHEIKLVNRHIDLTGLEPVEKKAILAYLDPYDERYNLRTDVTTCLIGFDFEAYTNLAQGRSNSEAAFETLAAQKLRDLNPEITAALKAVGIKKHLIELFLFPFPSVQVFRDIFHAKIEWDT